MPGAEKQPTPSGAFPRSLSHSAGPSRLGRLFFQIPNRMLMFVRRRQPHPSQLSMPDVTAGCTHLKNRCRSRLASVSAYEHPDLTYADRGLLDRFPDRVAP
jgi:hypothetical protein